MSFEAEWKQRHSVYLSLLKRLERPPTYTELTRAWRVNTSTGLSWVNSLRQHGFSLRLTSKRALIDMAADYHGELDEHCPRCDAKDGLRVRLAWDEEDEEKYCLFCGWTPDWPWKLTD